MIHTMSSGSTIGDLVRRMRGKMSVVEAHRRTGLSREWWAKTESGATRPTPAKLIQAADALGGDTRALLEAAGYDPTPYLIAASPIPATIAAQVGAAFREIISEQLRDADSLTLIRVIQFLEWMRARVRYDPSITEVAWDERQWEAERWEQHEPSLDEFMREVHDLDEFNEAARFIWSTARRKFDEHIAADVEEAGERFLATRSESEDEEDDPPPPLESRVGRLEQQVATLQLVAHEELTDDDAETPPVHDANGAEARAD